MITGEPNGHQPGGDVGVVSAAERVGRHVSSLALFRGQREIVILHRGQEYRLRITKSDKLILTK